MSNKNKYSVNELENIINDINKVIDDLTSEYSKLDRTLIFSLRMNMSKINDALEIIQEDLEDPSEKFQEFEKKKMNIIQKYGGKIERDGNSYKLTNQQEVFTNEDFKEELVNISKEYDDAIKEQNEKFQKNTKLRQEKIAEVEWKEIPLSIFPEKISGNNLPLSFIEFVYEDNEKGKE